MSGLLSVIVPVYNTERFLPRCLDSIAGQTYRNLEIILVDDGSTDGSGRICDEYAVRDGRVRVIHKENGGAGSARNAGLDAASGEFVTFVDSDDFLDPDAYRIVMDARSGTDPDVACFGMTFFHGNKERRVPFADAGDLFMNLLRYRTYMHSPCNKVIRRGCLDGKAFRNDMQVTEDLLFVFDLLTDGCRILYLDDSLYHYRRDNMSSVTRLSERGSTNAAGDSEKLCETILDICESKKLPDSRSLRKYKRFLNANMALPYINDAGRFSPDIFRKKSLPWNFYSLRPDVFIEELFAFMGVDFVPESIVFIKKWLKHQLYS